MPQKTVLEAEVTLPQGWTATLPEGASESSAQGAFEIRYTQSNGKVTARLELTLRGGVLQPAEYGAFRSFNSARRNQLRSTSAQWRMRPWS